MLRCVLGDAHFGPLDGSALGEGRVAGLPCDDEVVVEGDAEDIARLAELPGHLDVLPARLLVARRVVVGADDRRGVVQQGRLVDVAGADHRPAKAALRRLDDGLNDVGGVQEAGDEHLAGRGLVDLLPEELAHFIGGGHLGALARAVEAFLLPELDTGFADGVVFEQSHRSMSVA